MCVCVRVCVEQRVVRNKTFELPHEGGSINVMYVDLETAKVIH